MSVCASRSCEVGRQAHLPPPHAEHLALAPLVELALFSIFQEDTLMAWHIESKKVVLEIGLALFARHVHIDNALGQRSRDMKVHVHVRSTNAVSFGARSENTISRYHKHAIANVMAAYAMVRFLAHRLQLGSP